MSATWTAGELSEFDKITMALSSRNQMDRIHGRIEVAKFEKLHGKEKCDAMFAHLMAPKSKRKPKVPA